MIKTHINSLLTKIQWDEETNSYFGIHGIHRHAGPGGDQGTCRPVWGLLSDSEQQGGAVGRAGSSV